MASTQYKKQYEASGLSIDEFYKSQIAIEGFQNRKRITPLITLLVLGIIAFLFIENRTISRYGVILCICICIALLIQEYVLSED